jgi:hypothetical protein
MAQQSITKTTLQKLSLIQNLPVEFSLDNRRSIKFVCPTINDIFTELDIRTFLTVISLSPEKIKELKMTAKFDTSSAGKIIQGFMGFSDYGPILQKYFLKYILNSTVKENAIFVNDEKVLSNELEYIADVIQMSLNQKTFVEDPVPKSELEDPVLGKILKAQQQAEEKLKKAKAKKTKSTKGYAIEDIMLSISYEFGISMAELLNKTYFSLTWHFGFVPKVDAHKLNQLILSSGMSKKKNYSYWLNT